MSRPELYDDLPDYEKKETLAVFHIANFSGAPELVEAMSIFQQRAGARGCRLDINAGSVVTLDRRKTEEELDKLLKLRQSAWDSTDKRYWSIRDALESDSISDLVPKIQKHEKYSLDQHAKGEGHESLPEDIFS